MLRVIELGDARQEQTATEAAAPLPVRALLGLLTLLLLPLLAAGAHHGPPRPPVILAAHLGDTTFVDGDLLFVVGAGPVLLGSDVQNRIVSAYRLPAAELLSQTTVAVSGPISDVRQAGDMIVVAYQVDANGNQAVAGLIAGTARAVWRRTAGLLAVSVADRLVLLATTSAVTGADLTTGADRWSVPHDADGSVAPAGAEDGYPPWLVSATGAGRVETHDARTGKVIAAIAERGVSQPVGDLLLSEAGPAGLTGYHLPDLTRRWHSDVDLSQSWTQIPCGAVICAFRPQSGVTVLDPATGRRLWAAGRWAYAEPVGPYLIATVLNRGADDPRQWILDPPTGRVLGDFGPWQALGPGPSPGLLYGKRDTPGGYVVWYGVLDPRTGRATILGDAQRVSGDCQVTAGVLICRLVDASVAVWRLR